MQIPNYSNDFASTAEIAYSTAKLPSTRSKRRRTVLYGSNAASSAVPQDQSVKIRKLSEGDMEKPEFAAIAMEPPIEVSPITNGGASSTVADKETVDTLLINTGDGCSAAIDVIDTPQHAEKPTRRSRPSQPQNSSSRPSTSAVRTSSGDGDSLASKESRHYEEISKDLPHVVGVSYNVNRRSWVAHWQKNRRVVHRHFSVRKFGFHEARDHAITHRLQNATNPAVTRRRYVSKRQGGRNGGDVDSCNGNAASSVAPRLNTKVKGSEKDAVRKVGSTIREGIVNRECGGDVTTQSNTWPQKHKGAHEGDTPTGRVTTQPKSPSAIDTKQTRSEGLDVGAYVSVIADKSMFSLEDEEYSHQTVEQTAAQMPQQQQGKRVSLYQQIVEDPTVYSYELPLIKKTLTRFLSELCATCTSSNVWPVLLSINKSNAVDKISSVATEVLTNQMELHIACIDKSVNILEVLPYIVICKRYLTFEIPPSSLSCVELIECIHSLKQLSIYFVQNLMLQSTNIDIKDTLLSYINFSREIDSTHSAFTPEGPKHLLRRKEIAPPTLGEVEEEEASHGKEPFINSCKLRMEELKCICTSAVILFGKLYPSWKAKEWNCHYLLHLDCIQNCQIIDELYPYLNILQQICIAVGVGELLQATAAIQVCYLMYPHVIDSAILQLDDIKAELVRKLMGDELSRAV